MKTIRMNVTNWSQRHIKATAVLCCLLNIQFFALSSDAQSAKAATGEAGDVAVSASTTNAGESQNRVVDLQFGGSLCMVCLNAFKMRLSNMAGVKNVEINVDKINPKSSHPPKVAHAVVGYDPDQISVSTLIETIKRNDFQFLAAKPKVNEGEDHNLSSKSTH